MPQVEFDEEIIEPVEDVEDVDEETGEANPNFIYDGEEEETPLPEVVKRSPQYKSEDIFMKANAPDPVKPPKKKRVLTEEHKLKLASAREKALETRRKNAGEKKRIKELEHKAKQKKTKELEDYVEDKKPPVVEQVREKIVEREPTITKKDLEDAQLDAIIKYEALRKQRKIKKQEDMAEQKKKDETLNLIRKATQPRKNLFYGQDGYWDDMY